MKNLTSFSINQTRRVMFIFMALILAVIQFSCVTRPSLPSQTFPSQKVRVKLGKTAIVSARYLPETGFKTFAKGKISGATKGMLAGLKIAISAPIAGGIWGGYGGIF